MRCAKKRAEDGSPSAQKIVLARNLAQCLNPQLPIGVHQKTIRIYELIFKNLALDGLSWAEDLGLFSMGLLPFMKFCSVQVRDI